MPPGEQTPDNKDMDVNEMPILTQIDVSLEIEASPETVWAILTTPDLFSIWMEGKVEFEAKVGSPFRAAFPHVQTVIAGEVVTLDADARHLGLTWGVESGHHSEAIPAGSSLVEFRVYDTEGGCRVELSHSRLPSGAVAEGQEGGWRFHLSKMALYANRTDLEVGLERTLEGWFSAWSEPDGAARLEILGACCEGDIEFRDDWTVAVGIEQLNQHIAMCFQFMPGWKLEPTGDVRICRGEALVGWRSTGPDGAAPEGFNHVSAARDGTLRRVTGFQAG